MLLSKILPFCCLVLGLICIFLLNLSVATADNPANVAINGSLGLKVQSQSGFKQSSSK